MLQHYTQEKPIACLDVSIAGEGPGEVEVHVAALILVSGADAPGQCGIGVQVIPRARENRPVLGQSGHHAAVDLFALAELGIVLVAAEIEVYGAWIDLNKRKLTNDLPDVVRNLFPKIPKTDQFEEILLKRK